MKHFMKSGIIILSFIFFLSGCSTHINQSKITESPTSETPKTQITTGKDLRADFSNVNLIDTKLIDNPVFAEATGSPSFAEKIETTTELKAKAEEIVQGQVEKVQYIVSSYGIPYTVIDLKITDSIAGNLHVGDKISILHLGGYMTLADEISAFDDAYRFENIPKEDWDTSIIKKSFSPDPTPQVGDLYVYCLIRNPAVEEDSWMEETYSPLNEQYGRYLQGEDGMYSRTLEDVGVQKFSNQNNDNHCEYEWLKDQLS
jgi:hypothetical protein